MYDLDYAAKKVLRRASGQCFCRKRKSKPESQAVIFSLGKSTASFRAVNPNQISIKKLASISYFIITKVTYKGEFPLYN